MSTRSRIIVTAPASAGASVRVYKDDGADPQNEARVFTSTTATAVLDQPVAVAAGASSSVYVDGPSVYYVSAKVANVEMAGGYDAQARVDASGGVSRVTVGAPPNVVADEILTADAPVAAVPAVWTVAVSGSPDGGTFTLVATVADFDGGTDVVAETAAIDFDATVAAMTLALIAALEAAGFDEVDVTDDDADTTFTFPPAVTLTLGDNSLTVSDEPGGDVDLTEVTEGANATRYPANTQIVDTDGVIYRNFGGAGLNRLGEGADPDWRQVSVNIAVGTKPTLDTTTDEASVVAQFNLLRTALIAWGLAIDGDE